MVWQELLYRQYTLNYRNNLDIRQSGQISHESGQIHVNMAGLLDNQT